MSPPKLNPTPEQETERPTESPSPSSGSPSSLAPVERSTSDDAAAAGAFIGDPGPAFDPGEVPEQPMAAPAPAVPEIVWEEDSVRSVLTAQGAVAHGLVGVAEQDWAYTEHDLNAIAPPLTRILNRYDATRALAGTGDELALTIGLTGYVSRSYLERKAELALRGADELEPEPITGIRAPTGTGPEDDAGYQQQQAAEGPGSWTV